MFSMFALYNFLLSFLGIILLPLLLLITLSREKYRGRTLDRLGLKSKKIQQAFAEAARGRAAGEEATSSPVIWIHALSVGEVTSAVPLVKALRADQADAVIVLTVGTSSGKKTAENLLSSSVELILSSPFDFRFSIQRYIAALQPDIFIQVETDFWPNWLSLLKKNRVPSLLINGRLSGKSFTAYQRFSFFFQPMFCSFDILSMQTEEDCQKMIQLGVPADKIIALGNLKYDMEHPPEKAVDLPFLTGENKGLVWICGSTHPGEEKILFSAFAQVLARQDQQNIAEQFVLILAPRDINRGQELVELAASFGLKAGLRSRGEKKERVLILDTLGELARCYGQADLAFVGGSLVPQGGHNPIEAAIHGVPVLFGPHMEDFSEIAQELVGCEGGKEVSEASLIETLRLLLRDRKERTIMGQAAYALVERHRGGVQRHVQVIKDVLHHAG